MFSQAPIKPHGSISNEFHSELNIMKLNSEELNEEKLKAKKLLNVNISFREESDLYLFGSGAYTPLKGFHNHSDWKSVVYDMKLSTLKNVFWPIPITLSIEKNIANKINLGEEISLSSSETNEIIATMLVEEKYKINKEIECKNIFNTTSLDHLGVRMVIDQGEINLAGPVKLLSDGFLGFHNKYQLSPIQSRAMFVKNNWKKVTAFQICNPIHRSLEYIAKLALELTDGLFIHHLVRKQNPDEIPSNITFRCVDALIENYFVKNTAVQSGYTIEMRYAGPREALLQAIIHQNYGCTHILISRDFAGLGTFYEPYSSQKIFEELWDGALLCKSINTDWTFWCKTCHNVASFKTCPHSHNERLLINRRLLKELLKNGKTIPTEFSRQEVINILKEYYSELDKIF